MEAVVAPTMCFPNTEEDKVYVAKILDKLCMDRPLYVVLLISRHLFRGAGISLMKLVAARKMWPADHPQDGERGT